MSVVTQAVTEFIEKYVHLVDGNNFTELYIAASKELTPFEIGTLTSIFTDINIDPLNYMTSIPYAYFKGIHLSEYVIPNHIDTIEGMAFRDTGISRINLNNIKQLDVNAFQDCEELLEIRIPISCSYIGDFAFCYSGIQTCYYDGTKEDWSKINKDEDWHYLSPIDSVICVDGKVLLE